MFPKPFLSFYVTWQPTGEVLEMAGWGCTAVTKERQRNTLHVPASVDTAQLRARERSASLASLEFLFSLLHATTCDKLK